MTGTVSSGIACPFAGKYDKKERVHISGPHHWFIGGK